MKRFVLVGVIVAIGAIARPASAGLLTVSGLMSSKLDADNVNYNTTITLTNQATSTDGVGTFWFSWVPGKDFMGNAPISEVAISGWTPKVTHAPGNTDGYAIQWVANNAAADIAPGTSLNFSFKSAETPAQLAGNSPFFSTIPEGTSFVYNGAPFSADSERFVVTPLVSVPEPSSLALFVVGAVALYGVQRRTSGIRKK